MKRFDPARLLAAVRDKGNFRAFKDIPLWEQRALEQRVAHDFAAMVRELYDEQETMGRELGLRRRDVELLQRAAVWARYETDLAIWRRDPLHLQAERECSEDMQDVLDTQPERPFKLRPMLPPGCPAVDLDASFRLRGFLPARHRERREDWGPLQATAWAVVDCAEVTEPRALIVENVPAFRRWRLYPIWCQALGALGYRLQERSSSRANTVCRNDAPACSWSALEGAACRISTSN